MRACLRGPVYNNHILRDHYTRNPYTGFGQVCDNTILGTLKVMQFRAMA